MFSTASICTPRANRLGGGGEPLHQHLPIVRGGRDEGRSGREAEERVNSVLQQWRWGA